MQFYKLKGAKELQKQELLIILAALIDKCKILCCVNSLIQREKGEEKFTRDI